MLTLVFDYSEIVPAVRMTQRGKWTSPDAQRYLNCKAALALKAKFQMQEDGKTMMPARTPLAVSITFIEPAVRHNRDIDNLAKTILDALSGVAFHDDRWIDVLHVERRAGPRRTVVLVEVLDDNVNDIAA